MKQVGDGSTADEKQTGDGGQQGEQRTTDVAREIGTHRLPDRCRDAVIAGWVLLLRARAEIALDLGLCPRDGDVQGRRRPMHMKLYPSRVPQLFRIDRERNPQLELARRERKRGRHHADDRVRFAVQDDRATDDLGIAAELSRPQAVAQDDDEVTARPSLRPP